MTDMGGRACSPPHSVDWRLARALTAGEDSDRGSGMKRHASPRRRPLLQVACIVTANAHSNARVSGLD